MSGFVHGEAWEVFDAECVAETDRAILVISPEIDEKTWVPKSHIRSDSEVLAKGDTGTLMVSSWFASQRGWKT